MLGINIGSLNTIYSLCSRDENSNFQTKILLSDVSSRTIPSIISFTENQRLIGEQAKNQIKKYSKSSFMNLSRLIGICPDAPFYKKEFEEYSIIGPQFDKDKHNFTIEFNGKKIELYGEDIVASFIDVVNLFFKKQNISFDKGLTISVPDYFTPDQKDSMRVILKSNNIKNFNIINESTSITLYYGYMKYKDLFLKEVNNKKSIDTGIVKNIIFIDSGHSKTTFILSQFKHNEFKVFDVMCLNYLGGRDFNHKIMKRCEDVFKEKYKKTIPNNAKIKYRLFETIEKSRKILTVNKETSINIDSLYDDEDFSYLLTKDEFEKLINEDIKVFSEHLNNFYKEALDLTKGKIDLIEMAGDLMRTPILQEIVKKITGKDLSKGILIDECPSVGAALYTSLINNNFPIPQFKGITDYNMYSILYTLNSKEEKIYTLIHNGNKLPTISYIKINPSDIIKNQLTIEFYNDNEEIKELSNYNFLIQFNVNLKEIQSKNKNLKGSFNIFFDIKRNGYIVPYQLTDDKNSLLIYNDNMVTQKTSGIYKKKNEEMEVINELIKILEEHRKIDLQTIELHDKTNEIAGDLYNLKDKAHDNENINKVDRKGRKLMERLNSIEVKLDNIHSIERRESKIRRLESIIHHIKEVEEDYKIKK